MPSLTALPHPSSLPRTPPSTLALPNPQAADKRPAKVNKRRASTEKEIVAKDPPAQEQDGEGFLGEGFQGTGDEWFKHLSPESLCKRLQSEKMRALDFYRRADVDKSKSIGKKEFAIAVRSLGFEKEYVSAADIDKVFAFFNTTKDGALDYAELDKGIKKVLAQLGGRDDDTAETQQVVPQKSAKKLR